MGYSRTLQELEAERFEWSKMVFAEATPISSLRKLEGEIKEVELDLLAGVDPTEEYADCLMCLFDSASRAGVSVYEITKAFGAKMEKNKARKWSKNPDNTYSHIKEQELTATDEQPAFLPLPTLDEQNANTPKELIRFDTKGIIPHESTNKVIPLTEQRFNFYYSLTLLKQLRTDSHPDSQCIYYKGELVTQLIRPGEPVPIDGIRRGTGLITDLQYYGKWSDLPETV